MLKIYGGSMQKNFEFKIFSLILILILVFTLFSCAPISNQADAEKFTNAMIKGYFIGDSTNRSIIKSIDNKDISVTYTGITTENFSGSYFSSEINTDFDLIYYVYNNSEITYEDTTYIVNGTLYWALDIRMDSEGFHGVIIAYGNLTVETDGRTQDVKFDAKYSVDFTLEDEDNDEIYNYTLSGSILAYVNDFIVNNTNWSITFVGRMFIA